MIIFTGKDKNHNVTIHCQAHSYRELYNLLVSYNLINSTLASFSLTRVKLMEMFPTYRLRVEESLLLGSDEWIDIVKELMLLLDEKDYKQLINSDRHILKYQLFIIEREA